MTVIKHSEWKELYSEQSCKTCKYDELEWYQEPCDSCCGAHSGYEPIDRIRTLIRICEMIASGEIPNNVYDKYLSKEPIGFMSETKIFDYLQGGLDKNGKEESIPARD